MFLELTGLCTLYRQLSTSIEGPLARLLTYVTEICRRPAYRDRVVRHPHLLRLYGMPIASLGPAGADGAELLRRATWSSYYLGQEEQPFAQLELKHILELANVPNRLPSYRRLYQRTLAASAAPTMLLTDTDVYCLTHTLFYASSFGRRSIGRLVRGSGDRIPGQVQTLLGLYVRRGDLDLTAELLLCVDCLELGLTPVAQAGWAALLGAQRPDGSMPGPKYDARRTAVMEESARIDNYVLNNYHTTIVAALAAVVRISRAA